jgi:dihydroorotate dehydrogenase
MSAYALARPFLFSLDPEAAHHLALWLARFSARARIPDRPVRAMGLEFPNPVGLAAGLDKDAAHIDGLARLGFGFIRSRHCDAPAAGRQSASQDFSNC